MFPKLHQSVTGTILVADDHASNRELLQELLTAQGFNVISVPDGVAALDTLATTPIDLASSVISGYNGSERTSSAACTDCGRFPRPYPRFA
jgi:CheY-like chemotaxis protein